MFELLYDENVLPAVIKLAEGARGQLVLVSPYNDFSVNLRNAVEQAARRVSVIAVCRSDQDQKEKAHLDWLTGLGAQVYLVERLHSKIYLNEEQAIVTSMNLLQGSAVNSKEIAFLIQDAETHAEILKYVNDRLIANAKPYRPLTSQPRPSGSSARPAPQPQKPYRPPASQPRPSGSSARPVAQPRPSTPDRPDADGLLAVAGKAVLGMLKRSMDRDQAYCIRCGSGISYDTEHPLCEDCYKKWAVYKDPDYRERQCHRCGDKQKTSYARPLCRECYRAAAG